MKSTNKQSQKQPQKQAMNPIPLSPTQLNSRQNQLFLIDVRGWLEYWMGHVSGAQRFSRDRILKEIPKDRAIAITCLSGHRSDMAAQWLVSQGYSKVHSLKGGLLAWQSAGYAVSRGTRP
jgi:rhodanese-related sulfurtransferase